MQEGRMGTQTRSGAGCWTERLTGAAWMPGEMPDPETIQKGDMPGDKVKIGAEHMKKAEALMPELLSQLGPILDSQPASRAVVAVHGGSGVGKSEIASLLAYHLNRLGLGAYTLSGDNYPHRIPLYNDAERLRIFRQNGIRGLIAQGLYDSGRAQVLRALQEAGDDANPAHAEAHPWMRWYLDAGRNGLMQYLGTPNEIDFQEVTRILAAFKNGENRIHLKRMGRTDSELWYDAVDFSGTRVLIIEWTHGNNRNLQGVDVPILLNSTPQETLAHRRARNRDGATDSPFTTMVLAIEQDLLVSQANRARIILSKSCELLSYEAFLQRMCAAEEGRAKE